MSPVKNEDLVRKAINLGVASRSEYIDLPTAVRLVATELMEQTQPFFSIIIPTYNPPERLTTCLESLTCQDYPRIGFEVIDVDDGK